MIRIAAVGDIHFAEDMRGRFREPWSQLSAHADVFILCGDLTNIGSRAQAEALAQELSSIDVPMVAILGNHDYHNDEPQTVVQALVDVGVVVLEGQAIEIAVGQQRLGIAGVKGFGGGFPGACGHAFGEPEMKRFVELTEQAAAQLKNSLNSLTTEHRVAVTHYAPVKDTLAGERLEIHPFLGAFQLGAAIDEGGAQLALHGHAHHGSERGVTPRGVPVRNVAMPLIKRPYALYCLDAAGMHGTNAALAGREVWAAAE